MLKMTGSPSYLVGIDDHDGCREGELAAQQPVLVERVQLLQVAQGNARLLPTSTRLHTLQSLRSMHHLLAVLLEDTY